MGQFTSDFMIRSFLAAANIDEAEQRLVQGKSSSKWSHLVRVLKDAHALQFVTKSFHVIEYLDHDVVARCVTIGVALCDMIPNFVVQLLSSVGTTIATSFVEIVVELKC